MGGVRELFDSGEYDLVVKLEYRGGIPGRAEDLRRAVGEVEGERMSLGELVAFLANQEPPLETRVTASFAAVDWFLPESWGYYAWPYDTLVRQGLDDVEGRVYPVDLADEEARALLTLYKGFGIVAHDFYTEDSIPVAILITQEPKNTVVFMTQIDEGGYTGYALVSNPNLIPILQEHGFQNPVRLDYLPNKPYKLALTQAFPTKKSLDEHLDKVRDSLRTHGAILLAHETKPLRDLVPVGAG